MKGRVLISEYGVNIQATVLAGDHYRTRHDALKHHVSDACRWAGMGCEVEVHNLFSGLIQQQGLSRAENLEGKAVPVILFKPLCNDAYTCYILY